MVNVSPVCRCPLPGGEILELTRQDEAELQRLCERCSDYMTATNGLPPEQFGARQVFEGLFSPGPHPRRQWWGLRHPQEGLIAVLDFVPEYAVPRSWCLVLVMIAPEYRRSGIGTWLLSEFERYARAHGAADVVAAVCERNRSSRRFLQRAGFEAVERGQPMQLGALWHQVLVMARFLEPGRRRDMMRLRRGRADAPSRAGRPVGKSEFYAP